MRYPAYARESEKTGIFFTEICVDKTGKINSVTVLNENPDRYITDEIERTINKTKGYWLKSKEKTTIIVPFIFSFIDIHKNKDGDYLLALPPNSIQEKFKVIKCIFIPPIIINGIGSMQY